MTSGKRRLDKLEGQLTPKQAALLWMADAHQFSSMDQYADSLKGASDSAWPIPRLCDQIYASVTKAMKGRPKEEIAPALRQAYLDVLFLFYLHQRVNATVMERERYFASHSLMLAQQLSALGREHIHDDQALWNRMRVGLQMPYPLDPETAAAVDAAIENYVMPWEMVEESDQLARWIIDSFVAQGKTELPEGGYR